MFNSREFKVGKLVEERIKELGMTKAEFGRRINTSRQNVNTLLRKDSMDACLLFQISKILNFNFFSCFEDKLPRELTRDSNSIPVHNHNKKTYSFTVSSDSESFIDFLIKKWREHESEKDNDKENGEDSALLIPA